MKNMGDNRTEILFTCLRYLMYWVSPNTSGLKSAVDQIYRRRLARSMALMIVATDEAGLRDKNFVDRRRRRFSRENDLCRPGESEKWFNAVHAIEVIRVLLKLERRDLIMN